jgi:hypothetical protein
VRIIGAQITYYLNKPKLKKQLQSAVPIDNNTYLSVFKFH